MHVQKVCTVTALYVLNGSIIHIFIETETRMCVAIPYYLNMNPATLSPEKQESQ